MPDRVRITEGQMEHTNPPLDINIRVFDIASDKEESKKQYHFSKTRVEISIEKESDLDKAAELFHKQKTAIDRKWKSLQDLIIWAMNNGKSVEFINQRDDKDEHD